MTNYFAMELKKVLQSRRSVRRFSPTEVSREILLDIVNQALTAPSSRNMRTTRFIIVDDKPTLEHLSKMRDYGSEFMKDATAAIIVAADTTKTDLWRENCAISATMLQLSIVDHGLASCWVHVAGRPCVQADLVCRQSLRVRRPRSISAHSSLSPKGAR